MTVVTDEQASPHCRAQIRISANICSISDFNRPPNDHTALDVTPMADFHPEQTEMENAQFS